MPSGPDPSTQLTVQILFLLFLILINAFFASAEMAIVSCSKNKIKVLAQDGSRKAELLLKTLDEPNRFLSTIQIAITFAGFLASASAAVGISDDLGLWIGKFDISYSKEIAVVVVTILLSFVTLVLGELYPKRVALHHPESIAMAVIVPLNILSKICAPLVFILSGTVNILLRLTRQNVEMGEESFSEDEVMSMLEVGREAGALKEEGKKMINSIFEFDDKLAYEVMTPRTDVFLIDVNDPPQEYLDELMELRYSRIPVYDDDTDNIIGILNIKDFFLQAREKGFENVDIRSILRKPYFIPETKNIDSLFMNLQSTKNHIAILIDEYGGFSGIVTLEDIIEEVMGDIDDEYDEQETEIEKISDTEYLLDGFASLDDINEELGLDLDSDNSETIGGVLIDILGEIPEDSEQLNHEIKLKGCICKILSVKEHRIEKIHLTIDESITGEEDDEVDETAEPEE